MALTAGCSLQRSRQIQTIVKTKQTVQESKEQLVADACPSLAPFDGWSIAPRANAFCCFFPPRCCRYPGSQIWGLALAWPSGIFWRRSLSSFFEFPFLGLRAGGTSRGSVVCARQRRHARARSMRPTVYYKPAPGSQQRKPLRGGASLLVRKPRARKQEWNNYLTDNQYSLSKEEVERRKKLFESKNNVLSENYAPPPPLLKPKKRKATPKPQLAENNELTSLDLLDLSSQTDELPRDVRRETDRPAAVVRTPSKPRSAASSSSPSSSSPSAASPSPPTHSARGTSPQKARKPTAVLQSPRAAPAMVPSREHSGLSAKDSTPRKLASQAADPSEALSDQDLHEMNAEIVVLFEELRAYESMTGKTSSIPSAVRFWASLFRATSPSRICASIA